MTPLTKNAPGWQYTTRDAWERAAEAAGYRVFNEIHGDRTAIDMGPRPTRAGCWFARTLDSPHTGGGYLHTRAELGQATAGKSLLRAAVKLSPVPLATCEHGRRWQDICEQCADSAIAKDAS
jgi:hypothetical protein